MSLETKFLTDRDETHVHVILGDVAATTFRQAFPHATLLIEQDVMSCGPTPRCEDLAQWRQIRHRFWATHVPEIMDEHVPSPHSVLDNLDRLRAAARITLWTATGVSEQAFIAYACDLLRTQRIDLRRVELVVFETLKSDVLVRGTGELDIEALRNHPQPMPLSELLAEDYLDAWAAMSAPDPIALERFATDHSSANEWIKQATRVLLRRFPDKQHGMPAWDLKMLECVRSHGSKAARVIAYAMHDGYQDGDLVGDLYLFGRLLKLADSRLPRPLIELSGEPRTLRHTTVTLTPFGDEVLDGRASNLAANPIDEWTGGVHLSTETRNVWVRDGERLVKC